MFKLSPDEAAAFYEEHTGQPYYRDLVEFMSSDAVVVMEIVGADAVKKWQPLMGPPNMDQASAEEPNSLRARFGHKGVANALHGSDSTASATRELEFFFGMRHPQT